MCRLRISSTLVSLILLVSVVAGGTPGTVFAQEGEYVDPEVQRAWQDNDAVAPENGIPLIDEDLRRQVDEVPITHSTPRVRGTTGTPLGVLQRERLLSRQTFHHRDEPQWKDFVDTADPVRSSYWHRLILAERN